MSYFNLRKQEPEAEPEEAEETEEEPSEEVAGEPEVQPPAPAKALPTTWPGAISYGICGPWRWMAGRFGSYGVNIAWTVHIGSVWAFFYYRGWVAVGLTVAWPAAFLLFIPREFKDRVSERLERRGAPAVDEEADGRVLVPPIVAVLWRLIGDAPGVHLKTLTERLKREAQEPLDKAAVRAKLGDLGIPLRGSVRDAAGKVNEGVHRDDLKAWMEALPSPASGTPPEPRSDPVATPVTCDVEKRRAPVATPLPRLRRLLSRGAD